MATLDVPPGTVFGRLTVISEARRMDAQKVRAMLCRCECGTEKVVRLASLRSGQTKSCGCSFKGVCRKDPAELTPGEVPLYGKYARGRIALVDLEDFELVMQYRWHVWELERPGRRPLGPYAVTTVKANGRTTHPKMHQLITGIKGVDHVNRNGLDNQRRNLRTATQFQNNSNRPGWLQSASQYKGVFWHKRDRKWAAKIKIDGKVCHLGRYVSEIEAALAYDAAARRIQGEFAFPNFPAGIPEVLRERVRAEAAAAEAEIIARGRAASGAGRAEWWAQRQPSGYTCAVCGGAFTSTAVGPTPLYCSPRCASEGRRRRRREKRTQGAGALPRQTE